MFKIRGSAMSSLENKKIKFRPHPLVVAMAYAMGAILPNTVSSAVTNDLNIYQQPTQGQTTVFLMLDATANMDDNYGGNPRAPSGNTPAGAIYADYPECRDKAMQFIPSATLDFVYGKQATNTVTAASANTTFPPGTGIPYCGRALTNTEKTNPASLTAAQKTTLKNDVQGFKYSRMDRMKIAMSLLLSDTSVSNQISLGLGQFSTATASHYQTTPNQASGTWISDGYRSKWTVDNDSSNGHQDGNDISGKILIANTLLDNDQRFKMRAAVGVMGSGGRTPMASALAESGAYMLGKTTLNANSSSPGTSIPPFWWNDGSNRCGNNVSGTQKGRWYGIHTGAYTGTNCVRPTSGPQYTFYNGNTETTARRTTDPVVARGNIAGGYEYSGFRDSTDNAKNTAQTAYTSPVPTNTASCSATGIFLLTNGIPTETPRLTAQALMRNALNDQTFTCPADNTDGQIKAVGSGSSDFGWTCMGAFAKRLYEHPTTSVKVAVAGFGNNFIPFMDTTKNLTKDISDVTGKTRTYYKCNALTTGTYTYGGQSFVVTASNLQDVKNACNLGEKSTSDSDINNGGAVGGYGQGGFYPIVEASDLAESIKNFVADLETSLPALNTGLPGIPVDTLNATQQIPYAFYSQFQPNTLSTQSIGIWLGNMKKYRVVDNTYKDQNSNNVIAATGLLNPTRDYWNNTTSTDEANAIKGGALSRLPVQTVAGRKVYSDRTVTGSIATAITTSGTALSLIPSNNTTDATGTAEILRASTDPDKLHLLNLLGFGISTTTPPANLTGATQLRQMGATLNSTPLFFTTKSKIATKATGSGSTRINVGDYIDRKDYVLFGTNQGLLQVIDANTGVEKFAFLPKEMIDRQKNGFIAKSLQTTSNVGVSLYQGIDGAWSVYADYVSNNESNSLKASTLNVYGGMRRGGTNYYALDLKDIETSSPKYLFKVEGPQQSVSSTTGVVTLTGTCGNTLPLNCMGQSWSKPTIAWIKWKGKPQLVMIVGGGYDNSAYDNVNYKSDTTATRGNGVYIFAAEKAKTATGSNDTTMPDPGALLWWGSSTATNTTPGNNNTTQKTNNANLKYSVVSEIKAIDRDSDGFVDNLYFGDLGGQVFRVDIDNASSGTFTSGSTTTNMVVKRIQRIANFITDAERSTRAAPRFYTMPTFTVHSLSASSTTTVSGTATTTSYTLGGIRGNATRFAVITIGSGDASNPLENTLSSTAGENGGLPDRVYGIFDRDVGRVDLYTNANDGDTTGSTPTSDGLKTKDITITDMINITATTPTVANMVAATNQGWYHTLTGIGLGRTGTDEVEAIKSEARYKVLSSFAAIKNTLFTSYFDAADKGSSTTCSAGVKGRSYIKNYCLPFGKIGADGNDCGTSTDGRGFIGNNTNYNIGAGVVPVVVGGMTNNKIGPITGIGQNSGNGVKAGYTTPLRFEPITWYAKRS